MAENMNFTNDAVGKPPSGWIVTMTGTGTPKWTVERDEDAANKNKVLKQSGKATYPVALKEETRVGNRFVSVKFKALSGSEDRAGGVVWRAKDTNNYYVVRANALEGNVVLYKTVDGKRTSLDIVGKKGGYGVKVPVASGVWHTLRIDFAGPRFTVSFNKTKLFEVEDSTFSRPGMVGLWTKADSVTIFDDFEFGALP
ncbi:MAG: hypothetical protein ACREF6_12925 [Alphaproteobacteria bacterium]